MKTFTLSKKNFIYPILPFLLLLSTLSFSQEWFPVGPNDVVVNNYYCRPDMEILCTPTGIICWDGINAQEYNSGLPVWGVGELNEYNILVIMGNGTLSDGVYKLNFITQQYEVVVWLLNPRFLYTVNNYYYVGYEMGLQMSVDGILWEDVPSFTGKDCIAMCHQDLNYVVSMSDGIAYSHDSGTTWLPSIAGSPWISDMAYGPGNKLFGIFPDESWSSGLWSSSDNGETWMVEFWDINMTSVYNVGAFMYLGWHQVPGQGAGEGVSSYDPVSGELNYMNDNLPSLLVNEISENMNIDCPNIVVCTDQGAYYTCDLMVGAEDNQATCIEMICYPNPFDEETLISFTLNKPSNVSLHIYSIDGRRICNLLEMKCNNLKNRIVWNGTDKNGKAVNKGLYYCVLTIGENRIVKKLIKS